MDGLTDWSSHFCGFSDLIFFHLHFRDGKSCQHNIIVFVQIHQTISTKTISVFGSGCDISSHEFVFSLWTANLLSQLEFDSCKPRPSRTSAVATRCGLDDNANVWIDCQLVLFFGLEKNWFLMIPGASSWWCVRMFNVLFFFFFSEDVQNKRHLRLSKIFFQPWEQCLQGRKSTNCITGPGCFFGLPTFNRQKETLGTHLAGDFGGFLQDSFRSLVVKFNNLVEVEALVVPVCPEHHSRFIQLRDVLVPWNEEEISSNQMENILFLKLRYCWWKKSQVTTWD